MFFPDFEDDVDDDIDVDVDNVKARAWLADQRGRRQELEGN